MFHRVGQGQVEPCWLHHSPMGWRGSPPREWPAQALTGPCGGGAGWRDACHSCCTRSWGWASRFLLPVLQPQHLASLREAATLWGVLRGSLGHGHQLWRPSGLGHSQVDEPVTLPACVAFFCQCCHIFPLYPMKKCSCSRLRNEDQSLVWLAALLPTSTPSRWCSVLLVGKPTFSAPETYLPCAGARKLCSGWRGQDLGSRNKATVGQSLA